MKSIDRAIRSCDSTDVKVIFEQLDKNADKDYSDFVKALSSAKTESELKNLYNAINRNIDKYSREYLDIYNKANNYGRNQREKVLNRLYDLMGEVMKKSTGR